jgi:hypothetical protein
MKKLIVLTVLIVGVFLGVAAGKPAKLNLEQFKTGITEDQILIETGLLQPEE